MISKYLKTLLQVIKLRSIIGYNGLVFALKKLPLIGKLIPDRLYATKELKILYCIVHVIKEIFVMFIGKIFGLGMIYLISGLLKTQYIENGLGGGMSEGAVFGNLALMFFIVYALAGVLINGKVFRCTPEKEYMVFMLRMNARELNNTLFIYDLAKLVTGYLMAGIVAIIFGAPVWVWLGIPVLAVLIKLMGTGAEARLCRIRHSHGKSLKRNNNLYVIKFTLILIMAPVVFIIIANGWLIPLPIVLCIVALLSALGLLGFFELKRFDSSLHKRALRDNIVREEVEHYREPDNTKSFKKLSAAGTVKGDKKGFEYLNALFVRRHRTMLVLKPVVFAVIIALIAGLIIYAFISSYADRFGGGSCLHMVLINLRNLILMGRYEDELLPYAGDSAGEFFRWLASYHLLAMIFPLSMADNSFKSTQAMYINCDNSLMTFSFFKKREQILKLFDIRARQLIRFNIAPVIAMGACLNLILFITGGQDYPLQYLVTFLVLFMLAAVYSIAWLALYYLLQPFTTTVLVKSGTYMIARVVITGFFTVIFWIPANSAVLAVILAAVTFGTYYGIRKLVYKYAPRTWRIKA